MSAQQTHEAQFQGLVVSLAAAAMQHLGKTLNPLTQKIEKNLEAAQATIDMLDMLEAKTKGNLSEDEAKLLKHILSDLKLNYVETLNGKPAEEPQAVPPAQAEPEASPEAEAGADSGGGAGPAADEDGESKPEQAG